MLHLTADAVFSYVSRETPDVTPCHTSPPQGAPTDQAANQTCIAHYQYIASAKMTPFCVKLRLFFFEPRCVVASNYSKIVPRRVCGTMMCDNSCGLSASKQQRQLAVSSTLGVNFLARVLVFTSMRSAFASQPFRCCQFLLQRSEAFAAVKLF